MDQALINLTAYLYCPPYKMNRQSFNWAKPALNDGQEVDYNHTQLRNFFNQPESHLAVSEQLQAILPLGFFRRIAVILLNAFSLKGTAAELVANVARETIKKIVYPPSIVLEEGATYMGFNRYRLFKVESLELAEKYVAAAKKVQQLYGDTFALEIYIRHANRRDAEMLGSERELKNHF